MAGEKILVVEDEQDIARLIVKLMQVSGYQTVVAYNGVDGLNLALRERPNLILLDMRLPQMDGMHLLYELRRQNIDAPVVVMTAWSSEELAVKAMRLGVRDYIKKPFGLEELLQVTERALSEERLRRERDILTKQLLISNQKLEQRVGQLVALYQVGQALASTLDMDELIDMILAEACRVLQVNVASIFLLDAQSGELIFRSGTGNKAQRLVGLRMTPGQGIAGWVAKNGEPLLVNETRADPHFSPAFDQITDTVTHSILCVPLMVKGRTIGVLEAINKPEPGFDQDDMDMLGSLAASAAFFVENTQLHQQTEMQLEQTTRAYSEIRALQETTSALLSTLDLSDVLDQIVNSLVTRLGYNAAMLAEYDPSNRSLPVRSISADNSLVQIGQELVGLDVLEVHVTMDQTENLAVRAAQAGEIAVTKHLFDLFRPLVTKEMTEMIQEAANIHTLATIPLMAKGRLVGNLFAGSAKESLSQTDLDSLQTFANQAAIAIENARLYQNLRESRDQVKERSDALEERLRELSRLQHMAVELGKVTLGADPRDVFRRLTENAANLLEADSSAIMLFDLERKALICQEPAFGVPLDVIRDYYVPLDSHSPAWEAWQIGGSVTINDVVDSPLVQALGLKELARRRHLRSTLLTMLRVGGREIGVLQVSDKRDGSDFTPDDERLLEIFASQSAIVIENARILQRMEALYQVGEAVTARLTLPKVLERVIQGINELFQVEGTSIWLVEDLPADVGSQLALRALRPVVAGDLKLDLGEGIVGLVAQTGRPLIVHDAQNDVRHSRKIEDILGFAIHSILCVPLRIGDEVSGVIEVINKIGSPFDQEDLEILSSVGASVAVAVENVRLFAREKERACEMEALVGIAQAVTGAVTEHPRALLENIARGVCEVLGADCAVVYPFGVQAPDSYDLNNVATFGTLHPVGHQNISYDLARIVCKRKLVVCEDLACNHLALPPDSFFEREAIRAFVGVVLEADEDELGVLYANFRALHRFDEYELTSVRLIAHQAALAIAKSRLFQALNQDLVRTNADLRRKVKELEELQTINNVIISALEIDKVMDSILRGAMSISGAPYAIILMDEQDGTVVSHLRQGDEISTERIDPKKTLLVGYNKKELSAVSQAAVDSSSGSIPWTGMYRQFIPDARSALYTPIMSGPGRSLAAGEQKRIGLLGIGSPRKGEFGPDDQRLLEALANQAAIAIQNARYLQAMRALQERQAETERIAAMADVAGNMVHRINNTVGAIRPLIQQVELKLDRGRLQDDYLCEKLQCMRENADRTLEIARQIQRPFRSIEVEAIDTNESLAAAWAELVAPVGVRVNIEYGRDLPLVRATRQLDEVFRNLIKNALDAMADEGGLLLIRSRQLDGKMLAVTFQDTGPGIPAEAHEHIFNMGFTTKPGGMGYGLWWSRMFLRRLGGDIRFENRGERGCVFIVILPTSEASP